MVPLHVFWLLGTLYQTDNAYDAICIVVHSVSTLFRAVKTVTPCDLGY